MKRIFDKKHLVVALSACGLMATIDPAAAVYLNPNGVGQVLIYPYYTARNTGTTAPDAFNTLFSIVNTRAFVNGRATVKAVRVALYSANSALVAAFNLYLSPRDTWTAAIIPTALGARLVTFDNSCTVVATGAESVSIAPKSVDLPSEFLSEIANPDVAREGYIEVIEMGNIFPTDSNTDLFFAASHVNGMPENCAAFRNELAVLEIIEPPSGGLAGSLSLLNVNDGVSYSVDAVALGAFSSREVFQSAHSVIPNLSSGDPLSTVWVENDAGDTYTVTTEWNNPIDAVSAVLMHGEIFNEFMIDPLVDGGTDWVITLPTKQFYGADSSLFPSPTNPNLPRCAEISLSIYDREEKPLAPPPPTSPPPPAVNLALCAGANVVKFGVGDVLPSASANSLDLTVPLDNGVATISSSSLSGQARLVDRRTLFSTARTSEGIFNDSFSATATYMGLPAVGFAVQRFVNGMLTVGGATGVLANYGNTFVHKFSPGITIPVLPDSTSR